MPQQQTAVQCQQCFGGGVVNNNGQAQMCPLCDGSGKQYIPGLWYVYGLPSFSLLANAANVAATISILNAPFKWVLSVATSTGPFSVQIQDGKNSRSFFNVPLHSSLVFGTAQNPFPVLTPYLFNQNGLIQITLGDLSGAPNTVWLGFVGLEMITTQTQ